jgi:succinoglycan biosynthesis protein ExoA
MTSTFPLVTVILPIRNEIRYLGQCLKVILTQVYPSDRIEVIVVDGMSTDGTREMVAQFAEQDARIKLLDNPERIVPTALNLGIRAARGDIIVRVDGHTVIAQDYVRRCVEALNTTGASNVGGPMHATSNTLIGQAIVLATSSPFGVGGARFHYAKTSGWVDTVYMGAFPRAIFDRVGMFDEELVRNQDDEFNFRLIRGGGKIWLDPEIKSDYFSRATLRGLWKQYFEYGFWKVRVIQKHGRPASWRHLVPLLFVLALAIASTTSLLTQSLFWILGVVLPYLFASFIASLWIAAREGWGYALLLPFAFATMHLAYGIGFGIGVLRLATR